MGATLFPPAGVRLYHVGELTRDLKQLVEDNLGDRLGRGRSVEPRPAQSGHLYLTLKDEEAPLRAVIYRGVALRLRFDLRDGMRVIVRGRLTVYVPRGEYQLQVEEVQPKGIGPLELAFRQLKEKLFAQGLLRAGPQEADAAHPAARRPRHQPDRLGGARHARNPVAALAGRARCGSARCPCRAKAPRRRSPRPCDLLNRSQRAPAAGASTC